MPRQRLTGRINAGVIAWVIVVAAADIVSKWWARGHLQNARHLFGPVWLRLAYNSGISFSLNQSSPVVTIAVTLVIVVVVAVVAARATPGLATAGFGLLLGGGLANEGDRLLQTPHQVTDFIAVSSFPVFNLADIAVSAGFVALVVALWRSSPVAQG